MEFSLLEMNPQTPVPTDVSLDPLIFTIRGHRVILDADLAKLYGSTTKAFNQALKRNIERFPPDFAFQLIPEEVEKLRSQFAGAVNPSDTEPPNWSQFVTSSNRHRGKVYLPWAFTEHGALMAANILRNERAVQMSIYVVRAFVKIRQQILENETTARRLTEVEWTLRQHDDALIDLYGHLEPLMKPAEDPKSKRRMGF